MFVGYLNDTTVGADGAYIFNVKYNTNKNFYYNTNTGLFTVLKPGWYSIHFDTSASAANGNIIPTLMINGVASTHAMTQATSTAVTDYVSASFDTVLHIIPNSPLSYATLQFVNNGIEATTESANVTLERLN